MANANANANSCLIYGTNTGSGQTITMTGNATTVAAINAPNADFSITGNGEVWGSVIARNIALNGGVRYKVERDQIPALADDRRDSKGVYVGTAVKF